MAVLQIAQATSASGQEPPVRATLPAGLWFGMNYKVVRERLKEQGASAAGLEASGERFKGSRASKLDGMMIRAREAKSATAWFLGDTALVGLEFEFDMTGEYSVGAWVDSVRIVLENKYGPPVHSDLTPGYPQVMGGSSKREAVWSVADSEIRLTVNRANLLKRTLDRTRSGLAETAHLTYGIPPFRKGDVSISQEP